MTVRYETTTIGRLRRGTVTHRALSVCSDGELARPLSYVKGTLQYRITEGRMLRLRG